MGEDGGGGYEATVGDATTAVDAPLPPAMYFVVVAARDRGGAAGGIPRLSLFTDATTPSCSASTTRRAR